jgi:hypothetical protein
VDRQGAVVHSELKHFLDQRARRLRLEFESPIE